MPTDAAAPLTLRTHRFKVRREAYAWLEAAAVEVNQVWNWANATSQKAARPFVGAPRWLTGFDLNNLSAGATEHFPHIGADTIQRVNGEFATRRRQFKKVKLRFRASRGARRALGWVPFKAASLRHNGRYLRFCGKTIRVFEAERFGALERWKDGCFAQDAVGDWWLCLPAAVAVDCAPAPREAVGVDLGLKDVAVTSAGARLEAGRHYRDLETKIAQAQRRGHTRRARRLHRRAARQRADRLHKFSRALVNEYQNIYVGDVSSVQLAGTRMAKAVLDSSWGLLRAQLQYKGQQAGRRVQIVNETYTSRACSACGALSGPAGVNGLRVRSWRCRECGVTHDRDVNAAKNILTAGRLLPSVSGNEPKRSSKPPRRASPRPRKAGTASMNAAA